MRKVFLITEFGSPFEWTSKYIENAGKLGQYGWHWKIFTPNKYENLPDNVEIIDMTCEQYGELVEKKLGVKTNLRTLPQGKPSVHITDFYIFSGIVFEDYTKGFDFWGITNMDVLYGRLDHFVSDQLLQDCDVFTDDVETINGVFCLFRNNERVNNLFRLIKNWKDIVGQRECGACVTDGHQHRIFASDEIVMTDIMKEVKDHVRYRYPQYYPWSSHDRLEIHVPTPKLSLKEDGSLWELIGDTKTKNWEHHRPFIGREIMYYHFQDTKQYPQI